MADGEPGVPADRDRARHLLAAGPRARDGRATGGSPSASRPKKREPFTALVVDHATDELPPHSACFASFARLRRRRGRTRDRDPPAPERARMSRRRCWCLLLLAALALALAVPAALADGDPASDYLLSAADVPLAVRRPHPGGRAGAIYRDAREREEEGLPAQGRRDRHPLRPRLGADPLRQAPDLRQVPRPRRTSTTGRTSCSS